MPPPLSPEGVGLSVVRQGSSCIVVTVKQCPRLGCLCLLDPTPFSPIEPCPPTGLDFLDPGLMWVSLQGPELIKLDAHSIRLNGYLDKAILSPAERVGPGNWDGQVTLPQATAD